MFTGIITDIGTIESIETQNETRFCINTQLNTNTFEKGASIACAGVCLTVVEIKPQSFVVEISEETLGCTTLQNYKKNDPINLEQALKIGQELGGHFVTGHVDTVTEILSIEPVNESVKVQYKIIDKYKKYIAEKGSVTLDGVSLTVNEVNKEAFSVNLIPHTLKHTTFQFKKPKDKVNLEIDILSRYIARMQDVNAV